MSDFSLKKTGFTLVEVMVALVVGGLAVALAAGIYELLNDRVRVIGISAGESDRAGSGELTLRFLAVNLTVRDTIPSLMGSRDSIGFPALCEAPLGWLDQCKVELAITRDSGSASVKLRLAGAVTSEVTMRSIDSRSHLLYLGGTPDSIAWSEEWNSKSLPRAFAIVTPADTFLYLVKFGG